LAPAKHSNKMLDLGAKRDDLYHDYAKGFIKVSGLPDVVPLTAQGLVITARTVSFLSFGHELVGQRVTRRGIDETSKTEDIPEGHAWEMDGKISGWLPPSANDGVALFRCGHDDGDAEDIDEEQARGAVRLYEASGGQDRFEAKRAAACGPPALVSSLTGTEALPAGFSSAPRLAGYRKWTTEELKYCEIVVRQFKAGILTLPDGIMLYDHLSTALGRSKVALYRCKHLAGFDCAKKYFASRRLSVSPSILDEAEAERHAAEVDFRSSQATPVESALLPSDLKVTNSGTLPEAVCSSLSRIPSPSKQERTAQATLATTKTNKVKSRGSSSKYKGVHPNTMGERWYASIWTKGANKRLGTFDTEEEAAEEYDRHAVPLGRDLNFPRITSKKRKASSEYNGAAGKGSSKYKGVQMTANGTRWYATIFTNGGKKRLGTFDTEEEAAEEYDRHAAPLGRDLNFPTTSSAKPSSKFRGVSSANAVGSLWKAEIMVNGKKRALGTFESKEEAAREYDHHARSLGRPLNFPGPSSAPIDIASSLSMQEDGQDSSSLHPLPPWVTEAEPGAETADEVVPVAQTWASSSSGAAPVAPTMQPMQPVALNSPSTVEAQRPKPPAELVREIEWIISEKTFEGGLIKRVEACEQGMGFTADDPDRPPTLCGRIHRMATELQIPVYPSTD